MHRWMLCAAAAMGCGPDVATSAEESSEGGGSESSSTIDATTTPTPDDDSSTTSDGTSTSGDASTSSSESSGEQASTSSGSTTGPEPKDCFVPIEYESIQPAIDDPLCATIHVASGEYYENLVIDRDVEIIGTREETPWITGENDLPLVTIGDAVVAIRHFDVSAGDDMVAGCIESSGDLTLEDVNLGTCLKVGGEGAGIRSTGPLTLVDVDMGLSLIQSDLAVARPQTIGGGAIYIEGAPLLVQGTSFSNQHAVLGQAAGEIRGGMLWAVDADVVIEDSWIWPGGTSQSGEGIRCLGSAIHVDSGSLRIERTEFHWGYSGYPAETYGAVFAVDSDVTVEASSIATYVDAEILGRGGFLHAEASVPVVVAFDRANVSAELSVTPGQGYGGAISLLARDGGEIDLSIVNSLISSPYLNGGAGDGAVLYAEAVEGSSISAFIVSSSMVGATIHDPATGAVLTGRADASSTVTIDLRDSLLWESGVDDCSLDGATLISNGHNMFSAPGSCSAAAPGDLEGVDPLIVLAAPTEDSPTIDAGEVACTDAADDPLTIDFLGNPRPVGTACDIGAIEYQP